MYVRLRHLWETLTSGYWFVPALMMLLAGGLALGLIELDRRAWAHVDDLRWSYGGGASGARSLLSTVAGSVVTVAGVVFSITVAALSQASSQFGPRLLRNFMRDTGNQVVLGTFVSTFAYCLLVLRSVVSEADGRAAFVPHAAVTGAVVLALSSTGVLIYFIHHVSVSLQAPAVVATVAADLAAAAARLPEHGAGTAGPVDAGADPRDALPATFAAESLGVRSSVGGYVQAVDYGELVAAAARSDLFLRLECRPGDHLMEGQVIARAWPPGRCPPGLEGAVNATLICGRNASPEQDVEHAVRQIVEVGVRALSPGVNDPFTAVNCVDVLGALLCRVHRLGLPGPLRFDPDGRLRLVVSVTTFDGLCNAAFHQLRQNAGGAVAVLLRLLEVCTACGRQLDDAGARAALGRHAAMAYRQARRHVVEPEDLADVDGRWRAAREVLGVSDRQQ